MALTVSEYYPEINGSLTIDIERVLYSARSEFQKIDIVQSEKLGRILLIDDLVMLTERDEFVYHEMIAHVPLFAHRDPRRVLIVGGGDGGTARECIKHPNVKVDLVDIDRMVSEACLAHIPSVANALLSDRVRCHYEDGVSFVKNSCVLYDVIIIDSTDPISVGEGLFTREFYHACSALLEEGGVLVNQSESPSWQPEELRQIAGKLRNVFPAVRYYQAYIPTYPSGHWAFGFATKDRNQTVDVNKNRWKDLNLTLRYYNTQIHAAAFALPTFVKELVGDI